MRKREKDRERDEDREINTRYRRKRKRDKERGRGRKRERERERERKRERKIKREREGGRNGVRTKQYYIDTKPCKFKTARAECKIYSTIHTNSRVLDVSRDDELKLIRFPDNNKYLFSLKCFALFCSLTIQVVLTQEPIREDQ